MRSGEQDPCKENPALEAAVPEESVIVISDDEGDVSLGLGNSVLLIEDANEDSLLQEKKTLEVLDEELAITFSRKAHVMPHARYDCTTHSFQRLDKETQVPIEENAKYCDECYCYLCDKPASECSNWESLGFCHCNAHNKCKYWKEQRDTALAGVLTMFHLDLTEIDAELKEGGNKLQLFLSELSQVYCKYLEGSLLKRDTLERCLCACHKDGAVNNKCNTCTLNHTPVKFHSYSEVYKAVTDYLNQADVESPKTAAVMFLGTAKELVLHKALPNPFTLKDPVPNLKESSVLLMKRIVTSMQQLLVLGDYPKSLYDKFVLFFQSFTLPPHLFSFTSSLNVIRWEHYLLTSVLAGQNVTGIRTNKGKKESLWEALPVIQARVTKLEEDASYRQLVRYLNVVQSSDYDSLTAMRQKLCFYMCKYGDFSSAANCLLTKVMQSCISKFFTPELFELHITMLRTRSFPPDDKLEWSEVWVPHDGELLKKGILIRVALRMLFCNDRLYYESKCWSALVRIWCTKEQLSNDGKLVPLCIFEPDKMLQQTVIGMSFIILDKLQRQNYVSLPEPFLKSFGSCAELILIIQATVRYMMAAHPPLIGMLELVAAFGLNHWALQLLIEGISPMPELLFKFVTCINKELYENDQRILDLLRRRGSSYLLGLMPVFLLHPNEGIRTIGFHFIDLVLGNIAKLPWTGPLAHCLQVKILPHAYMINSLERQKLMTVIGRLTTRC